MIDLKDIKKSDILSLLSSPKEEDKKTIERVRRYRSGNHWQDGEGWIGPVPDLSDRSIAKDTMGNVEAGFISENLILEALSRERASVLGREPMWRITVKRSLGRKVEKQEDGAVKVIQEEPTDEEKALINEIDGILSNWYNNRKFILILKEALMTYRSEGRFVFRIVTPERFKDENGRVSGTLEESAKKIFIDTPSPDSSAVVTEPDSFRDFGIFQFTETGINDSRKARTGWEVCFVDDDGNTVHRIVRDDGQPEEASFDLDGKLLLYEIKSEPLITPSILQNQALFNMAMTMMHRNVVFAGFRERVGINIDLPGKEQKNEETGQMEFFPDVFHTGVASFLSLQGTEVDDAEGRVTRATPGYVVIEPVSVQTFAETAANARFNILNETDQQYVQIAGDATASGISRTQAASSAKNRVMPVANEINWAASYILEAVMHLIAEYSGRRGRYKDLKVDFNCKVKVVDVTPEEIAAGLTLVEGQIWDEERLMTQTDVDDPEVERAMIQEHRPERLLTNRTNQANLERTNLLNKQILNEPQAE